MSPPFNKWRCKEMQVKISSQNFSRDTQVITLNAYPAESKWNL